MFKKIFLDHPRSVNESFIQHFFFAIRFSLKLFSAASAAFVHAFIPSMCEKTASKKVTELYHKIHNRGS